MVQPTPATYVVKRIHKTQLEITLNNWTNSGYALEYLFPPSQDSLFTCVFHLETHLIEQIQHLQGDNEDAE